MAYEFCDAVGRRFPFALSDWVSLSLGCLWSIHSLINFGFLITSLAINVLYIVRKNLIIDSTSLLFLKQVNNIPSK